VQHVAELLVRSAALCEVLPVYLAQGAHEGVAMLLAELAIFVAVPTVQTWLFQRGPPWVGAPAVPAFSLECLRRLTVADSQSEPWAAISPAVLWRPSRPLRSRSEPDGFILPCQPALADRGSRYVSGRTRAWIKTKNPDFEGR